DPDPPRAGPAAASSAEGGWIVEARRRRHALHAAIASTPDARQRVAALGGDGRVDASVLPELERGRGIAALGAGAAVGRDPRRPGEFHPQRLEEDAASAPAAPAAAPVGPVSPEAAPARRRDRRAHAQ